MVLEPKQIQKKIGNTSTSLTFKDEGAIVVPVYME